MFVSLMTVPPVAGQFLSIISSDQIQDILTFQDPADSEDNPAGDSSVYQYQGDEDL